MCTGHMEVGDVIDLYIMNTDTPDNLAPCWLFEGTSVICYICYESRREVIKVITTKWYPVSPPMAFFNANSMELLDVDTIHTFPLEVCHVIGSHAPVPISG